LLTRRNEPGIDKPNKISYNAETLEFGVIICLPTKF